MPVTGQSFAPLWTSLIRPETTRVTPSPLLPLVRPLVLGGFQRTDLQVVALLQPDLHLRPTEVRMVLEVTKNWPLVARRLTRLIVSAIQVT